MLIPASKWTRQAQKWKDSFHYQSIISFFFVMWSINRFNNAKYITPTKKYSPVLHHVCRICCTRQFENKSYKRYHLYKASMDLNGDLSASHRMKLCRTYRTVNILAFGHNIAKLKYLYTGVVLLALCLSWLWGVILL